MAQGEPARVAVVQDAGLADDLLLLPEDPFHVMEVEAAVVGDGAGKGALDLHVGQPERGVGQRFHQAGAALDRERRGVFDELDEALDEASHLVSPRQRKVQDGDLLLQFVGEVRARRDDHAVGMIPPGADVDGEVAQATPIDGIGAPVAEVGIRVQQDEQVAGAGAGLAGCQFLEGLQGGHQVGAGVRRGSIASCFPVERLHAPTRAPHVNTAVELGRELVDVLEQPVFLERADVDNGIPGAQQLPEIVNEVLVLEAAQHGLCRRLRRPGRRRRGMSARTALKQA
ncbi:MAG: hypothetical protein GWO02_09530 [Gammaproteobacteria bacterium]|nr:hypothetical protein [Gammaproteobacteria bacterium]